jgi:hypothetical protein
VYLVAIDHDDPLVALAARAEEDRQRRVAVRPGLDDRAAHLAPIPA